jgi:hypothetical protein
MVQAAEQAEQHATDQAKQQAALQPMTPIVMAKARQPSGRSSYGILRYLDYTSEMMTPTPRAHSPDPSTHRPGQASGP